MGGTIQFRAVRHNAFFLALGGARNGIVQTALLVRILSHGHNDPRHLQVKKQGGKIKNLLKNAEDEVVQGNLRDISGDSNKVMTVYSKDNPLKIGDTIQIAGNEVEVEGITTI